MVLSGNRWGDDDDDYLPPRSETPPNAEGVRTITEWNFDNDGNKVMITKKVKTVNRVKKISKKVLERREWPKFGAATNTEDNSNVTYTSFEDISIEDPNVQIDIGEKKEEESLFSGVKNSAIVLCRHCGIVGNHWTLKCPFKTTAPEDIPKELTSEMEQQLSTASLSGLSAATGGPGGGGNKYVAPAIRIKEQRAAGDNSSSSMDDRDNATLRVTNISTDTRESDLQELFSAFGPILRIYLAKDRETRQSRGFAFVSFHHRSDAEKALKQLQGFGYDHLILKLEWAKPSTKPSTGEGMKATYRSGYGKPLPQSLGPSVNPGGRR